jgi:hypothetical protein
MERVMLALLSGLVGLLVGLFAPGLIPGAQNIAPAEQAWLNPAQPTAAPTQNVVLARATTAQTAVPPTLQAAPTAVRPPTSTPQPAPAQQPPEPAHTFVIALAGGGEMKVVANDEAAARNNVREQGGTPAN